MTQPTDDAFGVRPDPLLEPDRRPSFRLPYDDVAGFAARRLRHNTPELGVDTFGRLDSALNDRVTWCSLGDAIADLELATIASTHFAHGAGPSAHEAVDAPTARLCTYVHRLGVWLCERRHGEGYVACLLRHEGAEPEGRRYPVGLAAELADFRAERRLAGGRRTPKGDPGLEGAPAALPWRYVATEVAQAIGSAPRVQGPWLPGMDLTPLREVIRAALVRELGDRSVGTDELHRALAVLGTVETIKATGGAAEIAGVRIEPCDDYGRTRSAAIADAVTPAGSAVATLLGEMVNGGVGFDPQALADAAIRASADLNLKGHALDAGLDAGLGGGAVLPSEPRLGRRRLEVHGQVIRTADGEETIAMASAPSWARLLVDAWHTFPLTDPDAPAAGQAPQVLVDLVDISDAITRAALSEGALAAFREAWEKADAEGDKGNRVARGMAAAMAVATGNPTPDAALRAWDGGLVPSELGWTPPLTAENARVLEDRGIDIVGAPIHTPLCVCGHERAVHTVHGSQVGPCAVLSSVPHHDCDGYEAATVADGGEL